MTAKRAQPHLPGFGGKPRVARVRRYVDRQLKAQRTMGQLEPVDNGLIGLAMTAADAVDRDVIDPDVSSWTLYKGIDTTARLLLELRGERAVGVTDGVDVELVALTHTLRDVTGSVPSDARPRDPRPPDPAA